MAPGGTLIVQSIKKFLELVRYQKREAGFVILLTILCAIMEAICSALIMPILAIVAGSDGTQGIGKYLQSIYQYFPPGKELVALVIVMVGATLLKCFLDLSRVYLSSHLAWRLSEIWYNTITGHYLKAPLSYIHANKQGILLQKVTEEPVNAGLGVLRVLQLIAKLVTTAALYTLLLLTNAKITLALTVMGGGIFLGFQKNIRRSSRDAGRQKTFWAQRQNAMAAENLLSIRLIKALSLEKKFMEIYEQISAKQRRVRTNFDLYKVVPEQVGELLIVASIAAMVIYLKVQSQVSVLELLPLLGITLWVSKQLMSNLSYIASQQMLISHSMPALSIVYDLLHKIPKETTNQGEVFSKLTEDIIFKNVSFTYDGRNTVLNSASFTFAKGKMTALIGPSGVGKSTIADLLLGFIQPNGGEILINKKPLQTYNLESWRKKIGLVSQDVTIFNTTISENIRYGNLEATKEQIIEAAKAASLHDFISSLPQGYETEVGDRGVLLSGGQRQRLAIARTIIRNPELYIFDEATSSLDSETEKLIQAKIEEFSSTKTVIVITHRTSTIQQAAQIYDLGKLNAFP